MSEKEKNFIKTLWGTAGTILAAFIVGSFVFYRGQIVQNATQQQIIEMHEKRISAMENIDEFFPSNKEFTQTRASLDSKILRNSNDINNLRKEVKGDLIRIDSKIDKLLQRGTN